MESNPLLTNLCFMVMVAYFFNMILTVNRFFTKESSNNESNTKLNIITFMKGLHSDLLSYH